MERFFYDNAGRIIRREHTYDGVTTYTFDDRGLLTNVTKPGTVIDSVYDAFGVRKSKTVNGDVTRFITANIFGLPHVLMELDATDNVKVSHVYAGGQPLKEEPVTGNRSEDLYLLTRGVVGSVTHAMAMNGTTRHQYQYDAFGQRSEVGAGSGSSNRHYGYTGEEFDEESGLLYLRARYYDPALGRFVSADPYWGRLDEPVTQNRFIYVHNNPLLFVDPSGLTGYTVTGEFKKFHI